MMMKSWSTRVYVLFLWVPLMAGAIPGPLRIARRVAEEVRPNGPLAEAFPARNGAKRGHLLNNLRRQGATGPLDLEDDFVPPSHHSFVIDDGLNAFDPWDILITNPMFDVNQAYESWMANSLRDFEGRWKISVERSGPSEEILTALGVSPFKVKIMQTASPSTEIRTNAADNTVEMRQILPAGITVSAVISLDGSPFITMEKETGEWSTRASFRRGRLMQIREGVKGTMYDVRAILREDPEGRLKGGPFMVFKWTFIPIDSQDPITVERWMFKLPEPQQMMSAFSFED